VTTPSTLTCCGSGAPLGVVTWFAPAPGSAPSEVAVLRAPRPPGLRVNARELRRPKLHVELRELKELVDVEPVADRVLEDAHAVILLQAEGVVVVPELVRPDRSVGRVKVHFLNALVEVVKDRRVRARVRPDPVEVVRSDRGGDHRVADAVARVVADLNRVPLIERDRAALAVALHERTMSCASFVTSSRFEASIVSNFHSRNSRIKVSASSLPVLGMNSAESPTT
jgi:hypothetical protein